MEPLITKVISFMRILAFLMKSTALKLRRMTEKTKMKVKVKLIDGLMNLRRESIEFGKLVVITARRELR